MKAQIFGTINETIECTPGLLTTVYIMVGGKKHQNSIKKIILDNSDIPDIEIPDIKAHLEIMKDLLLNSFILLNDSKASLMESNAGDPPEEYVFMARMQYVFIAMSIIELSKLFISNNSHYFNIYSFLKRLNTLKNSKNKIKNIELYDSTNYMETLNELENNGIIENLRGLRDKIFAHTDKGVIDRSINYKLSISNLEQLISVGYQIINDISVKLFENKIDEFIPDKAVEGVLKILNKELKGI